jgi:ABC-type transport system involved in multi-copper enzyme maturation permease subunit
MLTQTSALFLDAYRELNAKRMFWIVLALSLLVVASFAIVGINANGITILHFEFPSLFNTHFIPPATFYKILFAGLGVGYWLNWAGLVLALVSTAAIYPDFVAGGSVDLYLSKPLSRLRLLLTKYATGLLFATLQVLVFSTACFLLIGLRAGVWDPRLFIAVPVVVLIFSYLFCVCTLVGLVTRSTVAALLVTILFWLLIFGVETSEQILFMGVTAGQMESQAYQDQFASFDRQEAALKERVVSGDTAAAPEILAVDGRRRELEEKKRLSDPRRQNIATAHRLLYAAKTVLPKKGETNALLQRWLRIDTTDMDEQRLQNRERRRAARATAGGWFSNFRNRTEISFDDPDVLREVKATLDARPVSWVLGTSLAFEAVILALASWIFCRRDY